MRQGGNGDCQQNIIGGSNNTNNCVPPERHLTSSQRDNLVKSLQGKKVVVEFGTLYNVPDGQQYAFELCSAIQQAIPSTVCNNIDPYVPQPGHPWSGLNIVFKQNHSHRALRLSLPPDTPGGMIVLAFVSAGINQGRGPLRSLYSGRERTYNCRAATETIKGT